MCVPPLCYTATSRCDSPCDSFAKKKTRSRVHTHTCIHMSDSEVEEYDKSPLWLSPRSKSFELHQEVFGQRKYQKRTRPLYGYNFSPPSTPNGNHLIAAVQLDVEEEDEAAAFTPRCVLRQCIEEQKALVQVACVNPTDADWILMASYLSPAKPPLHPNTKTNIHPRACRFEWPSCQSKSVGVPCLCISCAGLKAKPMCTPCLVCGALIPYSVCIKSLGE